MSSDNVSNRIDDLAPWVKRIHSAVNYTGPYDHEDVRSILREYSEEKDKQIQTLKEEAIKDAELIRMLQDCKSTLEKSVQDLQCLVPKKLTNVVCKKLTFKKARSNYESYGFEETWTEPRDYVYIQYFNNLCTKYGATIKTMTIKDSKRGRCVIKVNIVGAHWGAFIADTLEDMGHRMDKIRYTR